MDCGGGREGVLKRADLSTNEMRKYFNTFVADCSNEPLVSAKTGTRHYEK